MFEKILIANRGEIALRVIRACKELGIRTLAVYSEADVDSLHVQLADESICIGAAPSSESYLKIDRIMSAAEIGDVDAIHPGYGFLAENPHFAEVCESCNIKFIGPSSRAMQTMGDKNAARAFARKAGVPVTPGSDGIVESEQDAAKIAKKIGYPVMIKAAAGGGGRGMRVARNEPSLMAAFHGARHEAEKAFGNGDVYIEKLIINPHHIEFQIMADRHGHMVHLGERDCSIQRRHQKVIEECPSPLMTPGLRKKMGNVAVKLAKSVGYENAGTIEFLVDQERHFYFIEMNTRIQVEHTITEEVYGCDLVKEQIRIAAGLPLSPHIAHATPRLHAIQCRINAEDPEKDFQPSAGRIDFYYAPGGHGVRIDSHVYTGYSVPPYYDSMIAKIITVGATRINAIDRMRRALGEYYITGIKTTVPFHAAMMRSAEFRDGNYDTGFVERVMSSGKFELVAPATQLRE
ncbi:MAG TPA: acetyl-CoA carboxylase biotin carboxylase subunit [Chthoniobacterales bacterium]|jgi:acetyl-CoA carboxylase, biotin carboxylase subunit|nr:acetyl-CoA carboxylase biotin carboxylase subunit [Chthoniobacterales bacterium]